MYAPSSRVRSLNGPGFVSLVSCNSSGTSFLPSRTIVGVSILLEVSPDKFNATIWTHDRVWKTSKLRKAGRGLVENTPGNDSRRIVTDAPALALEVRRYSSFLPLLDGLDLPPGQLL